MKKFGLARVIIFSYVFLIHLFSLQAIVHGDGGEICFPLYDSSKTDALVLTENKSSRLAIRSDTHHPHFTPSSSNHGPSLFASQRMDHYSAEQFRNYVEGSRWLFSSQESFTQFVLNSFELYQYNEFLAYLKTYGQVYEDFILSLSEKIKNDRTFEEKLRSYEQVGGFKNKREHAGWSRICTFGLSSNLFGSHKDQWAFRDWATQEVEAIKQRQRARIVEENERQRREKLLQEQERRAREKEEAKQPQVELERKRVEEIKENEEEKRAAEDQLLQEKFVNVENPEQAPPDIVTEELTPEALKEQVRMVLETKLIHVQEQSLVNGQTDLCNLGHEYLHDAQQAAQEGDSFFEDRYTKRVQAIVDMLDGQGVANKQALKCDDSFIFDFHSFQGLQEYHSFLQSYDDTPLGRLLHEEVKSTLSNTSNLCSYYPDNGYVQTQVPVIFHAAALAKCQENTKAAFCLSDFCHNLFQITEGITLFSVRFLGGVAKGYLAAPFQDVKQWVTNPVNSLCKLVIGPVAQASFLLAQAALSYAHDPDEFRKQAWQVWENFSEADISRKGYLLGMLLGPSPTSKFARKNLDFLRKDFTPTLTNALEQQKVFVEKMREVSSSFKKTSFMAQPLEKVLSKADEYVLEVKKIMTYENLSKLLKKAKFTEKHEKGKVIGYYEHQQEVTLKNGMKVLFRRDVGKHAHPIGKKYPNPVDHYNIEIQVPYRGKEFKEFYNAHVILDANQKFVDFFGETNARTIKQLNNSK